MASMWPVPAIIDRGACRHDARATPKSRATAHQCLTVSTKTVVPYLAGDSKVVLLVFDDGKLVGIPDELDVAVHK